jgi:hypothetical protein
MIDLQFQPGVPRKFHIYYKKVRFESNKFVSLVKKGSIFA